MQALYRRFCALQARWAASFLLAMVALIFLGGVARMAGHPLNWTGDVATALFAWACFLCADIAWRRNSLMAIELVASRLPALAQRVVRFVNYTIICAFLLYVMGWGTYLSWVSRGRSFQLSWANPSKLQYRNSPNGIPGDGFPLRAVPWLNWPTRPTSMSAPEWPVPVVLSAPNQSCPASRFWKFCCFCPRSTEMPNFKPWEPASFVSLSLNCSASLCA